MELLPNDVLQHRFRASVRGYNREEVDQFLEHVAAVLEEALSGRQKAEEATRRLERDTQRFREQENALKQAVVTVQNAMSQAKDLSRQEVDTLKRNAQNEALGIISTAELKRREIENDLKFLRESRRGYVEQFKAFCTAQLRTLEQMAADYDADWTPSEPTDTVEPEPIQAPVAPKPVPSQPPVAPPHAAAAPHSEPVASDPKPWLPPRVSREEIRPASEQGGEDPGSDRSEAESHREASVVFPPPLVPPAPEPHGE